MAQNPTPPQLPSYEVLHSAVGVHLRGEIIPPGTYSEEQLARLVGLEAIRPIDPPSGTTAATVAQSSEEFKAQEDARAIEAAGGPPADVPHGTPPPVVPAPPTDPLAAIVTPEQAAALRTAGYGTTDAIRAATDAQLEAVPGIGPAAIDRLRAATRE